MSVPAVGCSTDASPLYDVGVGNGFKFVLKLTSIGVCHNDFSEPDPDITEDNPVVPDPVPDV